MRASGRRRKSRACWHGSSSFRVTDPVLPTVTGLLGRVVGEILVPPQTQIERCVCAEWVPDSHGVVVVFVNETRRRKKASEQSGGLVMKFRRPIAILIAATLSALTVAQANADNTCTAKYGRPFNVRPDPYPPYRPRNVICQAPADTSVVYIYEDWPPERYRDAHKWVHGTVERCIDQRPGRRGIRLYNQPGWAARWDSSWGPILECPRDWPGVPPWPRRYPMRS